jgi:hypothetical protein
MKGLPKFIIKVIFTVVTNFSLKSFNVYEGIPSLDHLCPSDWFWVPSEVSTHFNEKSFKDWPLLQWVDSPDIILTEEELTREIGHLDAVHVRHLRDIFRGMIRKYTKDLRLNHKIFDWQLTQTLPSLPVPTPMRAIPFKNSQPRAPQPTKNTRWFAILAWKSFPVLRCIVSSYRSYHS